MDTVFLGGSRRIVRLTENIRSKLDELIDRQLWMVVGDANGADRALQQHLADRSYQRVTVYAVTGMLRNNVGGWNVRSVDAPKGARGFDLYSVKDTRMAEQATYGLMIWDGRSRGTLENVRNLLAHGKPVAVHLASARRFIGLRSIEDLKKLGETGRSSHHGQCDFSFAEHGATQRATVVDDQPPAGSGRSKPKTRRTTNVRGRN